MTPDMAEKWLAQNTIECSRYAARLTPGACADYRRDNAERCKGCERLNAPASPREKKNRRLPPTLPVATKTKEREVEMAKTGVCACGCGKEGKIVSRGLLHPCYDRMKRSRRLAEFPTAAERAAGKMPSAEAGTSPAPPPERTVGQVIVDEDFGQEDLSLSPRTANSQAAQVEEPLSVPDGKNKPKGRRWKRPVGPCRDCGRVMRLEARGVCKTCRRRRVEAGTWDELPGLREKRTAHGKRPKLLSAYDGVAFARELDAALKEVREGLIAKNASYGDSALNPVRVFSQADPVEQIRVRIDDKLSRLIRGQHAGEDTEGDLLGYLVLLRVAERRRRV